MADGTPIHDAASVRIPFVPDREKVDAFIAELRERMGLIADDFVARIKPDAPTAAPQRPNERVYESQPLPGLPSTFPADIAEEFRKVQQEFAQVRTPDAEQDISEKLDTIIDKMDALLAAKTDGGGE